MGDTVRAADVERAFCRRAGSLPHALPGMHLGWGQLLKVKTRFLAKSRIRQDGFLGSNKVQGFACCCITYKHQSGPVFKNLVQVAPLDLGTENFGAAREPLIRERLQEIRCSMPAHIVTYWRRLLLWLLHSGPASGTHGRHHLQHVDLGRRCHRFRMSSRCIRLDLQNSPAVREGAAVQLIRDCWEENEGVFCRGINWERHSLDELVGAGCSVLRIQTFKTLDQQFRQEASSFRCCFWRRHNGP